MVKVLNSRELRSIDLKSIPDAVILAFNTLIVKNWSGKASEFKQSDVIAYVASEGLTEEEVIKNHWLDVEPLYRENGFDVKSAACFVAPLQAALRATRASNKPCCNSQQVL